MLAPPGRTPRPAAASAAARASPRRHHEATTTRRGAALGPMPAAPPPGAAPTLYVEGVPPVATVREMAHIFRPFDGPPTRPCRRRRGCRGSGPVLVEFRDACRDRAMETLKGYLMDRDDRRAPR